MASLNFNTGLFYALTGNIDFNSDTFYVLLVTSSYTPNKDTHDFRDDVTNEVVGTGYTAGGKAVAVTVTQDNANDRIDIDYADTNWTASTITAAACVTYKRRGGASSADEIINYVDFGGNVATTGGTFTIDFTAPFRFQN